MRRLLAITGLILAAAVPAAAHHAFGAEFDPNKPVLLKGTVTKIEWVNPHTWIHLQVTKPDGTKEVWMIEGGSPNSLLRRGVTKESVAQHGADRRWLSGARSHADAGQRTQHHVSRRP